MYTRKTLYFRASIALKHGQMHTILILLTIKQSNIIDFYEFFHSNQDFYKLTLHSLTPPFLLLHIRMFTVWTLRNILYIVALVIYHRLVNHSKFIKYFTITVVTTLFPTGNILYITRVISHHLIHRLYFLWFYFIIPARTPSVLSLKLFI